MLFRAIASALLLLAVSLAHGQDAFVRDSFRTRTEKPANVESAWLDLRQTTAANSKPQTAPDWVEAVTVIPTEAREGVPAKTVFRIRLSRPRADFQVLFFRLFFDDQPEQKPELVAWDESGTQVLQSGPLGQGVGLPTSESVMVPMVAVSSIDVEVPGDGKTIRGAYLDWMATAEVLHPISAERKDLIPEPFAAMSPLHAPTQDKEMFGTVTATLADETILHRPERPGGRSVSIRHRSATAGRAAQLRSGEPSYRCAAANLCEWRGHGPGHAHFAGPRRSRLPRRERDLLSQMRFQYTGWLRAQKLLPVSSLKVGNNDLIITAGPGTPASAIRATQVQLKYLWDKSDYQLQTDR